MSPEQIQAHLASIIEAVQGTIIALQSQPERLQANHEEISNTIKELDSAAWELRDLV